LYLGPPAIVRVRSKRGAVQSDQLAAADHLIDTMNQCGCHVLKIAESGYHEERLFAQLAIGLTNQVSQGYGRLSSVFARWAYRPNIGAPHHHADFRIVNRTGLDRSAERMVKNSDRPIFWHNGYRKYARREWLEQLDDDDLPLAVAPTIKQALNGTLKLTRDTLARRAWIFFKGRPQSAGEGEFPALFDYLWGKLEAGARVKDRSLFNPLPPRPVFIREEPDQIFEEFVGGPVELNKGNNTFLGGSIHDLIINFLTDGRSQPFIQILDKCDFTDLGYHSTPTDGSNVVALPTSDTRRYNHGMNVLMFREELPDPVKVAVTALYSHIAQVLAAIGNEGITETALRYCEFIMGPQTYGGGNRRWSFVIDQASLGTLLTGEMSFARGEGSYPEPDGYPAEASANVMHR